MPVPTVKYLEPDGRDTWRVFRIISEFVDGFESMTNIGPSVSIFGSARLQPASPTSAAARSPDF